MNLYQMYVAEMLKIIVHGVYYLVWHTAKAYGDEQIVNDAETIGKHADDTYNEIKRECQKPIEVNK